MSNRVLVAKSHTISGLVPEIEFWHCKNCNLISLEWKQIVREGKEMTWGRKVRKLIPNQDETQGLINNLKRI